MEREFMDAENALADVSSPKYDRLTEDAMFIRLDSAAWVRCSRITKRCRFRSARYSCRSSSNCASCFSHNAFFSSPTLFCSASSLSFCSFSWRLRCSISSWKVNGFVLCSLK